jgi:formate hydrogenlyase subunit 6/NADH:ubiquinone oxidoreductase subunit I
MIGYFKRIGRDTWAILKGLWVTFRVMWKPAITVQYPTEKLVPYERFRGALLFDVNVCISCSLCVKACPSSCIFLENATTEAGKKIAKVNWYTIDFGKCNYCRLCEEACPTKPKSVWHSLDYESVAFNRNELVRTWKSGDDFRGVWFDPVSKEWKAPGEDQIPIHLVAPRR